VNLFGKINEMPELNAVIFIVYIQNCMHWHHIYLFGYLHWLFEAPA
jgi:hypothetical protein